MEKIDIAAIVLAAGEGKRVNSRNINKVAYPFLGKPMITYGVELLRSIADKVVVVIGAFSESVKEALKDFDVLYAYQEQRLGTGHAVKIGVKKIAPFSPSLVLVGYGDHLMFYKKERVLSLIALHRQEQSAVSFFTVKHENPNDLAWGRVIRDKNGAVVNIVEQKDATVEEKKIKELNTGFYCFDFVFLNKNLDKLEKSAATGEYYLTDMVKIAVKQGKKVTGLPVPFDEVGIGVNRLDELEESQRLYSMIYKR